MESKTEITPTVIIIEPSGFTDLIEVDSNIMTKQELDELIDADDLIAFNNSDSIYEITESCGLNKQVTIYADIDGVGKDLKSNQAATMLTDNAHEIRGAIIIAMEDSEHNIFPFDTDEDIEEVFDVTFDLTDGCLIRDYGQEDGRYDVWC